MTLLIGWTTSWAADSPPLPADANLSDVLRRYPVAAAEMDTLRGRWAAERLDLKELLAAERLAARRRIAVLKADSTVSLETIRLLGERYEAHRQRWYTSPAFVVPVAVVVTAWATLQAVQLTID